MNDSVKKTRRKIRLGMVGGGSTGFIGAVHRMAARLDDRFDLVAGALSSQPERARASGEALGIDADRCYESFERMAQAERARADGIEAVAIVTPNHLHVPASIAFLSAGIHVICDKPLATTLEDGLKLKQAVDESGRLFVLTHTYSGYPLIRQARTLVESGALGAIRVVQAEYAQEWLATDLENHGATGAEWRTDPTRAGLGGTIGDIGTHAFHLLRYVTGLEVETLQAQVTAFVPGRVLDDDAQIMLRFRNGARGAIWASQVAVGHSNGLKLRVYGEKASLAWSQEEPESLRYAELGKPEQIIRRGGASPLGISADPGRVPAGHPEGYIEAFASIYSDAADLIGAFGTQERASDQSAVLPGIDAGLEGLRFVAASIRSSENAGRRESL